MSWAPTACAAGSESGLSLAKIRSANQVSGRTFPRIAEIYILHGKLKIKCSLNIG